MIIFHELLIGSVSDAQDDDVLSRGANPCPRCLRASSTKQENSVEPVGLNTLLLRIEGLSSVEASVMMCGMEPFRHPSLVSIVQALAAAKVRRVGMRTDAAALANPHDAQGCVGNGVRMFEIPFLPREMDSINQGAPFDVRLAGIQGIRAAATQLGLNVFVCADIFICKHTAPYFVTVMQAAIVAGVDAIRISFAEADPASLVTLLGGDSILDSAHSLAVQNSVAFFVVGDESFAGRYLQGAQLYQTITAVETASSNGTTFPGRSGKSGKDAKSDKVVGSEKTSRVGENRD